jgi:hypothetical protein
MLPDANTQPLLKEIKSELLRWELSTPGWGWIYSAVLVTTLAFPVVIAAEASLSGSAFSWVTPLIPGLAVVLTIAGAVEHTLKPRLRWLAYQDDRRDARALRTAIEGNEHPTADDLAKYTRQWKELQDRHGKNLP